MDDSPDDPHDENALVKLTSLVVLGAGLLALFLGYSWFWMVFALGFAVLVPIVKLATDALGTENATDDERRRIPDSSDAAESKQDALDTLRDRYARGDLSDEEFERKVERLLETETPESAREHVSRDDSERDDSNSRSTEREFE